MGDDITIDPRGTIQVDEGQLQGDVDEVVRTSVEETLNATVEAEADQLCRAQRYERAPARADTRAGHYDRKLATKAGQVWLKVPKLRTLPFETAIIERYKRREAAVEEALVEMYLAGVSVRRVEDITEALWGTRLSSETVSRLNQRIYEQIDAWRKRPITGTYPYVYLDGVMLKRSWGDEVRNVSVPIAIGVGTDGYRHILGVAGRVVNRGGRVGQKNFPPAGPRVSAEFLLRRRDSRRGRNPRTGDGVDVPPKCVAYFKPGKELKELINRDPAQAVPPLSELAGVEPQSRPRRYVRRTVPAHARG